MKKALTNVAADLLGRSLTSVADLVDVVRSCSSTTGFGSTRSA